ncbi:MAG: cell division protein FtsA, partial [Boseongicola sp. SB0664_bin_43]|nr:cell division protein FtsA [Boseongicola sp. SB0664_bin_43]
MGDLYRNQRAMRAVRKTAMQKGVIAVLDVGTSKIACLILILDESMDAATDEGIGNLAGQEKFRVIGAATTRSRGVEFGETTVLRETERAIRTAVQAAQKMAQCRVDHVMACASGGRPRSYGLAGQVQVEREVVTESDVANVLASCDIPDYGADREILHAQPVNFVLDHRSGLTDPRNQIGQLLACDMHMLTADRAPIGNLVHCVRRCDLELAGLAMSSYVSGISALVEDEQELGAACIDMGGGTTGISIFLKRHMIYADAVRIGGEHVTHDISMGFRIPMSLAERIKTIHGGVVVTGMDDRDMIEIDRESESWVGERRAVSRAELIGIMRPRVEEILEAVRERLDAAGFEHLPSQRIVLTGGASQVPGIDSLASRILGRQVRIGHPLRVRGLPQAVTGTAFSSAVGLSLLAAHPQDEC